MSLSHLPSPAVIDQFLAAALRGDAPVWPWSDQADLVAQVMSRVAVHGVAVLLHENGAPKAWPEAMRNALRKHGLAQGMWELRHQQVLTEVLAALHKAGIVPVLLKGTALAYSLYRSPVQRSRGDTDLLIAAADRERCEHVLLRQGFERSDGVRGEHVSYQAGYFRKTGGQTHALDVHWRISNSELLSSLFSYSELRAAAQPLPRLSPHALGIDRLSALLHACFHRSVHLRHPLRMGDEDHHLPNRLIWLKDIDLLARSFSPDEWLQAGAQATAKGLGAVCIDGMGQTRMHLLTPLRPDAALLFAPAGPEAPHRYLSANALTQQWMDFRALPGMRARLRFLRELFFPSAAYMKASGHSGKGPLAWLYFRRATKGVVKNLRHRPSR